MTLETMPRPVASVEQASTDNNQNILVVGPGANAKNLKRGTDVLARNGHEIHYAGMSTANPAFEIEEGRFHEVDTPEGQERLQRLIAENAFHAVYLSTPAWAHAEGIEDYAQKAGEGHFDFIVTTKPAVTTREEIKAVRAAIRAADARRRERLGQDFDTKKNPLVVVHEHYSTKGPWFAIREQLAELGNRLGRLESAEVHVQEARTAKEEGRAGVVGDGAFEDLGPHVMSLGLDVQKAINDNPYGQYTITDNSDMDVTFVRHDDSGFREGIETGFSITGTTQVIDRISGEPHELDVKWTGGKGLEDKKEVTLVFVDPETGVRSTVTANLLTNTLSVPDSVADLFPEREFEDNGYGASVAAGLNSGGPVKYFQPFEEAAKVVVWGDNLAKKGRAKGAPIPYSRGKSMEEALKGSQS